MTNSDGIGETLRKAMAVPMDTMITLDLPLLITKLSQIADNPGDPGAENRDIGPATPVDRLRR
ncbi:hypothetical protein [Sphingomonas bacterium]|uniref:hypothetical protein n=1 Tax=Sphingomonas bacterium TaxID=1895847 RepID=UPI0015766192|nr:hypothetical protein [Sphingomonas bacterium]